MQQFVKMAPAPRVDTDATMSDADVETLGIKALKELIASAGLSTEDCIDKTDLRTRAREAIAAKKSKPAAPSAPPSGGSAGERQLGGYQCKVNFPSDLLAGDAAAKPADLLLIVLHGLGATNNDFATLPSMLSSLDSKLSSARIACVFPQAPMSPIGAAWWSFDVQAFMSSQMMPDGPAKEQLIARLIRETPDGLEACRAQMATLIAEARALAGGAGGPLPASKILLAGFSLGAITSLDLALQMPPVCLNARP